MLDRISLGDIPRKHHIAFRSPQGKVLYEHCITRNGFDGPYTIAYHQWPPHAERPRTLHRAPALPTSRGAESLRKRHYRTSALAGRGPTLEARAALLFNRDVVVSIITPTESDSAYFSNGDADELYFIALGSGVLRTILGDVRFEPFDYLFVPKGVLHRFVLDVGVEQRWLNFECMGGLWIPDRYRNSTGQLRMDAPYSHRDFRRPTFAGPLDEGIRELVIKRTTSPDSHAFHGFVTEHSPLDVLGFDGTVYPFAFPIRNFQPKVGAVHLPPDTHGTFALRGGLICSFVPRVLDFHPEAIPCPYPHASLDCDEVLFYAEGDFLSRVGIERGSISHHPQGLTHGPHPGAYEKSIGVVRTDEVAVMMDCFEALASTHAASAVEDPGYHESFIG